MKAIITASALVGAMSTSAFAAENWENTTVGIEMISGPLDFSIDADEDGLTDVEVGFTTLEHSFGSVDANLRFALGTNIRDTDVFTAVGQYNASTMLTDNMLAYGTAEVAYTASSSFDNDTWSLEPSAGVAYSVTDFVAAYGEVGYTWDMSNDFSNEGGYVEVGLPIAVNDTVTITPSISHTFDMGGNEVANFRLETTLRF